MSNRDNGFTPFNQFEMDVIEGEALSEVDISQELEELLLMNDDLRADLSQYATEKGWTR